MKDYLVALVGFVGVLVGAITTSIGDYMIDEGSSKRAIQLESYKEYVNSQAGNGIIASQRKIVIYGELAVAQKVAALLSVNLGNNFCSGDRWLPTINLNREIRNAFYPGESLLTDREIALLTMGCAPPDTNV